MHNPPTGCGIGIAFKNSSGPKWSGISSHGFGFASNLELISGYSNVWINGSAFYFILIGKSKMGFLTGQSWRIQILTHRRGLRIQGFRRFFADEEFSFFCGAGYKITLANSAEVFYADNLIELFILSCSRDHLASCKSMPLLKKRNLRKAHLHAGLLVADLFKVISHLIFHTAQFHINIQPCLLWNNF